MRKKIALSLLIIITVSLVISSWVFQNRTIEAKSQANDLQNMIVYYENLTSTFQNQIAHYYNLTNAIQKSNAELQFQKSNLQTQLQDLQNQIVYYENSTNALQKQIAYYNNLTNTIQESNDDLKNQKSNLQNQLQNLLNLPYNVTIEDVSSSNWWVPVGVTMEKDFSITVKNIGVYNVGGLTVAFKIMAGDNVWDKNYYDGPSLTSPEQLGVLHVRESVVLHASMWSAFGTSFAGKNLVVTLMLDETVLDEYILPFQGGYP